MSKRAIKRAVFTYKHADDTKVYQRHFYDVIVATQVAQYLQHRAL